MNLIHVHDPADPRLADYANLRDSELRSRGRTDPPSDDPRGGLFIAEGEFIVRRLLASRYMARSVLVTPQRLETTGDVLALLPHGAPIFVAPVPLLDGIVGFKFHRGILAVGESGPDLPLKRVLAPARLVTVLEDIANLDNVGGIFRNVAAFGGSGGGASVLLNERCCDPLYRKAVRVSMGHVLHVPFTTIAPWPAGLAELKAAGFLLAALSPRPDSVPIGELAAAAPPRIALLLGAEGPGLTCGALAAADLVVRIPIAPDVDSLNVAVAAAVALHRLT